MKTTIFIIGLFLSISLAAEKETVKTKDMSDFPNIPGAGPYSGYDRKPNPPFYHKKTRTLRKEYIGFEKNDNGDFSKKFVIELYQINNDGTILAGRFLHIYPDNKYWSAKKHICMKTVKPFLFTSLPDHEIIYDVKEVEQWRFRKDKTLEQIVRKLFARDSDLCLTTSVLHFSPDGRMLRESGSRLMPDHDPLKLKIEKDMDNYYRTIEAPGPEWKSPVFIITPREDGTALIEVRQRKQYIENSFDPGSGTFHYLFNHKTKKVELLKRDR